MPAHERKKLSQVSSPSIAARWQGILNVIPVGAYTCDTSGLITYFNPPAEVVWGRAPKLRDPSDRYCGSLKLYLSNGTPIRHSECWMALALRQDEEYNGREIQIERPGGSRIFAMAFANPLHNYQRQLIGAVNLIVDITAQKKLQADHGTIHSIMAKQSGATLAMIEVAVSALAGLTWPTSAFR